MAPHFTSLVPHLSVSAQFRFRPFSRCYHVLSILELVMSSAAGTREGLAERLAEAATAIPEQSLGVIFLHEITSNNLHLPVIDLQRLLDRCLALKDAAIVSPMSVSDTSTSPVSVSTTPYRVNTCKFAPTSSTASAAATRLLATGSHHGAVNTVAVHQLDTDVDVMDDDDTAAAEQQREIGKEKLSPPLASVDVKGDVNALCWAPAANNSRLLVAATSAGDIHFLSHTRQHGAAPTLSLTESVRASDLSVNTLDIVSSTASAPLLAAAGDDTTLRLYDAKRVVLVAYTRCSVGGAQSISVRRQLALVEQYVLAAGFPGLDHAYCDMGDKCSTGNIPIPQFVNCITNLVESATDHPSNTYILFIEAADRFPRRIASERVAIQRAHREAGESATLDWMGSDTALNELRSVPHGNIRVISFMDDLDTSNVSKHASHSPAIVIPRRCVLSTVIRRACLTKGGVFISFTALTRQRLPLQLPLVLTQPCAMMCVWQALHWELLLHRVKDNSAQSLRHANKTVSRGGGGRGVDRCIERADELARSEAEAVLLPLPTAQGLTDAARMQVDAVRPAWRAASQDQIWDTRDAMSEVYDGFSLAAVCAERGIPIRAAACTTWMARFIAWHAPRGPGHSSLRTELGVVVHAAPGLAR